MGNVPMVGMVVTISPSFSLYKMVVFPAASRPTIKIRISFLPHSLSNNFEKVRPMIAVPLGYEPDAQLAIEGEVSPEIQHRQQYP